jgi:four helix bundle protein
LQAAVPISATFTAPFFIRPDPDEDDFFRSSVPPSLSRRTDHERLDVYHVALDFLVFANGIIEGFPRGRSHLADQFTRASTSILLNMAEGAGKLSKPDKRRYYLTARGSATESAALLDGCLRLKLIGDAAHKEGKDMLVRMVSMLIKLAQACEE